MSGLDCTAVRTCDPAWQPELLHVHIMTWLVKKPIHCRLNQFTDLYTNTVRINSCMYRSVNKSVGKKMESFSKRKGKRKRKWKHARTSTVVCSSSRQSYGTWTPQPPSRGAYKSLWPGIHMAAPHAARTRVAPRRRCCFNSAHSITSSSASFPARVIHSLAGQPSYLER